jgi:hypothetical protein
MTRKTSLHVAMGVIALFCLHGFITSCNKYYKPVPTQITAPEQADSVIATVRNGRYFILHNGNAYYAMNQPVVNRQDLSLQFRPGTLWPDHRVYVNDVKGNYRYKNAQSAVLQEVHFYLNAPLTLDTNVLATLPLSNIQKIEVIEHDKARTRTSYILGGVGITLAAIVVTGVIVAATKSSCPFVSTYDGKGFNMQGELFGGSVYPSLAREDYLPLKIDPVQGVYTLRISNELQERQYVDMADLIVAEHPSDKRAVVDANGEIRVIGATEAPLSALLNGRRDQTRELSATDLSFSSFDDTSTTDAVNELYLRFRRPAPRGKAVLCLTMKNSYWLDYLYGQFQQSFGDHYAEWTLQQRSVPALEHIRWSEDQHIPLTVMLDDGTAGKILARIKTIGPLTNREVAVTFDLPENGKEVVGIRLSTGFQFWDIDAAALGMVSGEPVRTFTLHPISARDGEDRDLLPEIGMLDGRFVTQNRIGEEAILRYPWEQHPAAGNVHSVFLHTRGYYEPIREYKGKADLDFLRSFRQPGRFTAFSREQYQEIREHQSVIALNH